MYLYLSIYLSIYLSNLYIYILKTLWPHPWYSFYRSQKDERLSQPCSHPLVLSTGLLDSESSAFEVTGPWKLQKKLPKWQQNVF